jgi:hypothetical protein
MARAVAQTIVEALAIDVPDTPVAPLSREHADRLRLSLTDAADVLGIASSSLPADVRRLSGKVEPNAA